MFTLNFHIRKHTLNKLKMLVQKTICFSYMQIFLEAVDKTIT